MAGNHVLPETMNIRHGLETVDFLLAALKNYTLFSVTFRNLSPSYR
jgi:hypothetical protein